VFSLETRAFAAANKNKRNKPRINGNNNNNNNNNKGFGGVASPPTSLEEILQSFPNRIPKEDSITKTACPCGSGLVYGDCCGPIHSGTTTTNTIVPSPLSVLRARYTAFCWRNIGYIMASTHSSCRDYRQDKVAWAKSLDKNGMFDSFRFIQLVIVSSSDEEEEVDESNNENDDQQQREAFIEFQVTLQSKESGQETQVAERSRFLRQDGQWLYAGGDVRSLENGVNDIILNT
jgi:SEC-C motif-containing protein